MGSILQQRRVQFGIIILFTLMFLTVTTYMTFFTATTYNDKHVARIDSPDDGELFYSPIIDIVIFINTEAIDSDNQLIATKLLITANFEGDTENICEDDQLKIFSWQKIIVQHTFKWNGDILIELYVYFSSLEANIYQQELIYTDRTTIEVSS